MVKTESSSLRSGFTTGTCATAAAYAAACFLKDVPVLSHVSIDLPDEKTISIPIEYVKGDKNFAEAAVRKFSGDDPDITNGILVIVKIVPQETGDIQFLAGEGIGTITKMGLSLPPGEPAINPVPRKMIYKAIKKVYSSPVNVTISIPGGLEIAQRTFNPRLGIHGGLSILGTTGIVRPFSNKAIQETIRYTISIAKASKVKELFLVPGNIGKNAVKQLFNPSSDSIIEVSNEWGFSLDTVLSFGFRKITIVGHPGKLAKIAQNKWDTHSSVSSSAFEFVKCMCESLIDNFSTPDTSTIEGLFQVLPSDVRNIISMKISNLIYHSIKSRNAEYQQVKVILTDMTGKEYGRSTLQ